MQDNDTKQSEQETDFNASAIITVTRGFKLPFAKLTLSGSIHSSDDQDSKTNQIVQRAIIFVIDRSYSMVGQRITIVKNALKPFIAEICDDEHTIIKLILFNKNVEHVNIPRDPTSAQSIIEKLIYASGGTDFHAASQALVREATDILDSYPTYQLTVIMCSDGKVGKQNAEKGHLHWKEFVNERYLKIHQTVPFVETIGISTSHDADVLDGFIVNDAAGNYCKCDTPQAIRDAFENAQDETMGRSSTKLCIEFPLDVHNDIYGSNEQNKFHVHDLILTTDEFKTDFWISIDEYEANTTGGNGLYLMVNSQRIEININEVTDNEECQFEAIAFYNSVLKDMLHILRQIKDSEALKAKAKEIENELNNEYITAFAAITSEPAEKQKLQKEIKELLKVNEDEKENMDQVIQRRAKLMKRYKQMNRIWKKHRSVVTAFQNTLSCVKTLVREIILGQVRMQEIRQHILDLHFRKKHAKRMSKLVLTDEQLEKRQKVYDEIQVPKESDCEDITDEIGSGCYLSTLSKQECVLDGDALWICGRVNRSGGAAVSNPELIKIEYISSDLVSDSYFRMAIEAAAGDNDDVRARNNVGFADSSRQLINARLFPIYGNLYHYKASKPLIHEVLSHTLSGRIDIRVVDYNSLYATVGWMISRNHLSHKNVKRILYEIIPSFGYFTQNTYSKPFKSDGYTRETEKNAARIKLEVKNKQRLSKYVTTFKARTTAWVSNAAVLFADRLMNLDIDFDAEFYLSLIVQRLRQLFSQQIPKKLEEDTLRNKVVANHRKILQILIRGITDENDDDEKEDLLPFDAKAQQHKKKFYALFTLPKMKPMDLDTNDDKILNAWNVNHVKPSSKKMMMQIFSRIEIRDLIQCNVFFETLSSLPCDIEEDKYSFDEFRSHKFAKFDEIPNDLNILCSEIGFKCNLNVLRAMCCVSIICHSNRLWQDNLEWFGDDSLKQIFLKPEQVLTHIYKQYVIKNMRHDYDVHLENKRIHELIEIHSDPVLPNDVDEFGNLPYLKCGWKKCGKEFDNRDKLLDHVRRCIPHMFVHRFHLCSRQILENNPDLTLEQFSEKTLALFADDKRRHINERELSCYYYQFKSLFKSGVKLDPNVGKQQPNILSTQNMYYFDQLATVRNVKDWP